MTLYTDTNANEQNHSHDKHENTEEGRNLLPGRRTRAAIEKRLTNRDFVRFETVLILFENGCH